MQSADRTAALPSTAFALLVLLQFPTITSDTKERAISWLLGRAERNPFSFALSRDEALQPPFTARPEFGLVCQCSLLLLVGPKLGDAGSGSSPGCCSGTRRSSSLAEAVC